MARIGTAWRAIQRYRWAAAAAVTIATLLVRDASVQHLFETAADKVRQAAGNRGDVDRISERSGFVRYALMVNSREQLEQARKAYNDGEGQLKGDALLEAQDRLRAAKARYREARQAFLPELARQCVQAKIAFPRQEAEALAALEMETNQ